MATERRTPPQAGNATSATASPAIDSPEIGHPRAPTSESGPIHPPDWDSLIPLVYQEIRTMAQRMLSRERSNHTLRPTEIVHEVYLKLTRIRNLDLHDQATIKFLIAKKMREFLIEYGRHRNAQKRGGRLRRIVLEPGTATTDENLVGIVELVRSLERLRDLNETDAEIFVFHAFSGLTHQEIADHYGMSEPWSRKRWRLARAWLQGEILDATDADPKADPAE